MKLRDFKKHKYLRVEKYNRDKSMSIKYYKNNQLPKDLMINPDHIFISETGYRTVMTNDQSVETINPLDFTSQFDKDLFTTAINNKMIKDTFDTVKTDKIDMVKMLLFAILIGIAMTFYLLYQHTGGFNLS